MKIMEKCEDIVKEFTEKCPETISIHLFNSDGYRPDSRPRTVKIGYILPDNIEMDYRWLSPFKVRVAEMLGEEHVFFARIDRDRSEHVSTFIFSGIAIYQSQACNLSPSATPAREMV